MPQLQIERNPFELMMNPEAIFAAIERSDRLSRLQSRICRPLDQPRPALGATDVSAFDAEVEATIEAAEPCVDGIDDDFVMIYGGIPI